MAYVKNGFLVAKGLSSEVCININNIRLVVPAHKNEATGIYFYSTFGDNSCNNFVCVESYEEIKKALGLSQITTEEPTVCALLETANGHLANIEWRLDNSSIA